MVYKKYITRGGKVFGPYYCESYRDKEGKVRTRFISGPKGAGTFEKLTESKLRFKVGRKKNFLDFSKYFSLQKPHWISSETLKKSLFLFFILFLGILLIAGLRFVLINSNSLRFTGFAIEQNMSSTDMENLETIVKNYETDSVDLSIKEPISSGLLGIGEPVTENKNKRMDFNLSGRSLRLYFDLLNYSEFAARVAEKDVSNIAQKEEGMKSNLTDRIINGTDEIINENQTQVNETDNGSYINETENNENQTFVNDSDNANLISNESGEEQTNKEVIEGNPEEIIDNSSDNYSNSSAEFQPGITGNAIQRFFGLVGRVIGIDGDETVQNATENLTQTSIGSVEMDINDIKQAAENLSKGEIETIADNSVISAEAFDINVSSVPDRTENKNNYKWGYRVKLNDLKFMAKIEVTSEDAVLVYDENTLKIGRNLLSFKDLADAGYKVRIENPALEIPINVSVDLNKVLMNITAANESEKASSNLTEVNITETNATLVNVTEVNKTEINITKVNATEVNVTINGTVPSVNGTGMNITIINETINNETVNINPIINDSELEENQGSEDIINDTNENKDSDKEEKKIGKDEKQEEKDAKKEAIKEIDKEQKEEKTETKEEKKEEKTPKQVSETPAEPAQEIGITGNIIKFFRITGNAIFGMGRVIAGFSGRVIGINENITKIADVKYANTITVYIEQEFASSRDADNSSIASQSSVAFEDLDNDGKISAGDIINLDPELIIIPITDAEHLDENRSFISDIYESVKEKDDNWSEVINESHFVRAVFSQALGKYNDITVFARVAGYFCNESVIENCSEIIINETTNETSQSCVNVSIENCPEINENEKGKIEIYRQDGNSLIAKIENITSANWYKTYLTGLADNETRDVFDLKIINAGNVFVNNSVSINGQEVPYDIYQKKKRIDEINALLNGR